MSDKAFILLQNLLDDAHQWCENNCAVLDDQKNKLVQISQSIENLKNLIESSALASSLLWCPPMEKILPEVSLRIREVASFSPKRAVALKARLWNSIFGRLYLKYLKPIVILHKITLLLWGKLCFFKKCCSLFYYHTALFKKSDRFVSLRDFVTANNLPVYLVAESQRIETPRPIVFPAQEASYLVSPHNSYDFPNITVTCIQNGTIYGGTNFVFAQQNIVHHDLYDPGHDTTSEELHNFIIVKPKTGQAQWLQHDAHPVKLTVAATFVDACAFNYAHWLTEVLSRIVLFCSDSRFKDVPIIVNADLHPNIMESLRLMIGGEREVIILPTKRAIIVEKLYVTSVAGYVPFGRRTIESKRHSHGQFSPFAFEKMNQRIYSFLKSDSMIFYPKKVYLRRNSGYRRVVNESAIEEMLMLRGFYVVEPERFTFSQQVRLFNGAEIIIGATGAAFGNIVFAGEKTRIIILISKYVDTSYWYWQNIACAHRVFVEYVLGNVTGNDGLGIHADYKVDINDILRALENE